MKAFSLSLLLALAVMSCPLWAQNTGSISGVVTDSSGAVVDGAQVTVTNQGSNAGRTVTSNSSGYYSVTNLTPGLYAVTVEKSGFKPLKFANTPLTVAQALALDASLSVGASEQTIEVNGAEVAPIETESAQLSTLVDSKTLAQSSSADPQPLRTGLTVAWNDSDQRHLRRILGERLKKPQQ